MEFDGEHDYAHLLRLLQKSLLNDSLGSVSLNATVYLMGPRSALVTLCLPAMIIHASSDSETTV
ncbi:hypothetical protein SAMN05216419_10177 [Nitrosomonas cryotolerans]|nr:hypothetical protein SAMN05216419_10177 [Nitrosomonas cryotolerans]